MHRLIKACLAEKMVAEMLPAIQAKLVVHLALTVGNCDRSIGARLSQVKLPKFMATLGMKRCASYRQFNGYSRSIFGVWNAGGLHI
jgi:glutamate synthase (NADPH/NADH) large chain